MPNHDLKKYKQRRKHYEELTYKEKNGSGAEGAASSDNVSNDDGDDVDDPPSVSDGVSTVTSGDNISVDNFVRQPDLPMGNNLRFTPGDDGNFLFEAGMDKGVHN